MAKFFTVLTRVAFILLGFSFLLALLVSFLVDARPGPLPLNETVRWDAITSSGPPNQPENSRYCYLIDRESNRCDAVPLPSGNRWGQVSVAPWRDAEGNIEAVCQALGVSPNGTGQVFWGLARLRLPDGQVIDEVNFDILPVGRACWVPTRPGRILFAAGDGHLYYHDFPGWFADSIEPVGSTSASPRDGKHSQIKWRCRPLFQTPTYMADPAWPRDPRLGQIVFATAIPQDGHLNPMSTEQCWLKMSDDGTAIEAAGFLEIPPPEESAQGAELRRFSDVGVGRDGTIHFVYLSRTHPDSKFRLKVVPLEIDSATGHPRVPAQSLPRVLDENCAPVSPVFSADGMSVYVRSGQTGLIVKRLIGSDLDGKIHVAATN